MKKHEGNFVFKTSYLQFLHLIIATLISLGLTVYGAIYWKWSFLVVELYSNNLPLSVFLLPGLFFLVILIFRVHNEKLILTPEYVLFVQGIMQWKQNSVRIEYSSIKQVSISETLLQRILGLGDLKCSSVVSSEQQFITMEGLKNPRKVKDLIMERIKAQTTSFE